MEKIHACPNDCILYRGAYKDLNACPDAVHCGIRSDEMTLVMLTASPQEEGSCEGDLVCSCKYHG